MRTPSTLLPAAALALVLVPVLAACGALTSATPPPRVGTAEDAFAAVRAGSPLFDGLERRSADRIGQGSWWDAEPLDAASGGGWRITVEAGWGDCQAGCIDRHDWVYEVAPDGAVALRDERGSPLGEDVLASLLGAATGTGIGGRVTAGPTCPVERPGDPACTPRAVKGATIVVTRDGREVAGITTDASGFWRVGGLEPGQYTVEARPVEGLMGTPAPATVVVADGRLTLLDLDYDTGIR